MNECVEMGTERGEVGAQPSHRKRSICQSAFKTKGNIKTKIKNQSLLRVLDI